MNKWQYRGQFVNSLEDIPECCPFICYRIIFDSGEFYIVSKQVYSIKRVKLSKKKSNELWKGRGPKPKYEIQKKESDWKTYNSSSKVVQEKIAKGEKAKFIILDFFEDKKTMLLFEAKEIIETFLNKNPYILNQWISIKTFK